MATRGSLGGLASTTADVAMVMGASGRDIVMIETVGVGQDEVDIVRLADVTIVVLVPGMGDDVQTIKAGIMEIADIFVINKSDRDGAERVEREIRAMQAITPSRATALREAAHHRTAPGSLTTGVVAGVGAAEAGALEAPNPEEGGIRKDDWTPPIVKTIASEGTGIEELLEAIESYRSYLQQGDRARARRIENWRVRIAAMLRDALFQRVLAYYLSAGEAARYAAEVAEHKRDPYSLVEEIVDELGKPE